LTGKRIGSLVLRAYPRNFRAARGKEMLGTLLDASEDSTSAFIRGVGSLLIGGLRERARENAQVGAGRLVADGFCLAAVIWSAIELVSDETLERMNAHISLVIWILALLAGVLLFASLGRDRLAGVCGLAVVAYIFIREYGMTLSGPAPVLLGHPGLVFFVDRWLGPLVCFMVMVLRPRVRSQDPRKLLWLLPVALLMLSPVIRVELVAVELLIYFGLPAAGLILLPVDPRLAIASAVFWTDIAAASTLGHTRLGLITLPIVMLAVLITVGRGKLLRVQAG
jgi:hypothetical protein